MTAQRVARPRTLTMTSGNRTGSGRMTTTTKRKSVATGAGLLLLWLGQLAVLVNGKSSLGNFSAYRSFDIPGKCGVIESFGTFSHV